MMEFVFKMMRFAFKMMNFGRRVRAWRLTEGANDLLRMQLSEHASGKREHLARM